MMILSDKTKILKIVKIKIFILNFEYTIFIL